MIITKEKIIEFFEDRCSAEDAEEIARYLQDNPQWLLDYFHEEEWKTFQTREDMPETWSERLLEKIRAGRPQPAERLRWMTGLKIAAAVIGISISVFLIRQRYVKKAEQPAITAAPAPDDSRDTLLVNRTGSLQKIRLADGSAVELSPASEIRLRRSFEQNKRTVLLSGEALFNIAEDKSRPFTVFTKGFSTTALGTQFRIRAYAGNTTASVQLLSGKVMVRNLGRPTEMEYLQAGQECTFSNSSNSLSRTFAIRPSGAVHEKNAAAGQPESEASEDSDKELVFKNQPLARVLSRLSEYYHTPIYFNPAGLEKRRFTGNVQKDQSLEDVLKTIAMLNDLLVRHQDSCYRVTLKR